jgi:hypothetical protein
METEMLRYGRLCHGPIARPPSVLARPTNMFFLIFVSVFEGGESECEGVMAGGDYGGGVGVVWAVTHDGLVPTVAHHNRSYDLVGLGDFSSSGVEEVGGRAGGTGNQPWLNDERGWWDGMGTKPEDSMVELEATQEGSTAERATELKVTRGRREKGSHGTLTRDGHTLGRPLLKIFCVNGPSLSMGLRAEGGGWHLPALLSPF